MKTGENVRLRVVEGHQCSTVFFFPLPSFPSEGIAVKSNIWGQFVMLVQWD